MKVSLRLDQFSIALTIGLSTLLTMYSTSCLAETRYISDFLIINIRDSIEQPFHVVTSVQSNDAVTVLDEQGNYAQVETEDGKIGWISSQYLKTQQPKSMVIELLQEELDKLKAELRKSGQLEFDRLSEAGEDSREDDEQLASRQTEKQALAREVESLKKQLAAVAADQTADGLPDNGDLADLQQQYERLAMEKEKISTAYEALLASQNEPYADKLAEQQRVIEGLRIDNERLKKKQAIYLFCAGALVFLGGIVSGRTLGRKKKRYSY